MSRKNNTVKRNTGRIGFSSRANVTTGRNTVYTNNSRTSSGAYTVNRGTYRANGNSLRPNGGFYSRMKNNPGQQSYNYGYYSSLYGNTSSAYKLYHEEEEQQYIEVPVKKRKRVVQKAVAPKTKKRKIVPILKEESVVSLPKLLVLVGIFLAFMLGFVYISANNTVTRDHILSMEEELDAIKEDNEYTRRSLNENINLKELEKKATALGLQKPAEYQKINITVPKESYTVRFEAKHSEHHTLVDAVKKLLEID